MPEESGSHTMTAISSFSVYSHCNNLGGKVWNPAIRWTRKYAVFVELRDTDGYVGVGECWCFDTAPDALIAYLRTEIAPHILGSNIDDFEHLSGRLTDRSTLTARHGITASALSGVDIAMWDIRSQQAETPLWVHLNPDGRGKALHYASGGLYGQNKNIPELVTEMTDMAHLGFRIVKMKIGALAFNEDLARVNAVLRSLPSNVKIILDGVYSYTVDQALRFYETLPADRIEAFQSPVRADDIEGMSQLVRCGVPVMATEAEYRPEIHSQIIQNGAVSFLQTASIACGGISRVMAMSKLVEGTETRLSLEISSTAVALMAAVHLAAAEHTVAHIEYHFVHQVFFDRLAIYKESSPDWCISPPGEPGLGFPLSHRDVTLGFETHSDKEGRNQ